MCAPDEMVDDSVILSSGWVQVKWLEDLDRDEHETKDFCGFRCAAKACE